MFGNGPFYFQLLRKYEMYFGYCFSNLYFKREYDDSLGQLIKVPIQWGSKNKTFLRVDADPNIAKDTSLTVPRMTYRYTGIRYDASRKLPTTVRTAAKSSTDPNKLKTQFTPMPFDIDFELNVVVNQVEDGTRIIEQIYPFFTPDWTATLDLIPEMGEKRDIPIIYKDTKIDDNFSGDLLENRILIYTLSFVMKAYLYGPVVEKPIIKFSYENFYYKDTYYAVNDLDAEYSANTVNATSSNSNLLETIEVRPGLDANGNPTTDANNSVAANTIYIDSNYDYIITANGIIKIANN